MRSIGMPHASLADMDESARSVTCPSCGGAGGGPVGRAGSPWDDEDYVCPRCEGTGMVALADLGAPRPGLVKAAPDEAEIASQRARGTAPSRKATG